MSCRYVLDTTDRGKGPGVLGQGTYGKVYLVTDTQSGAQYALKTAETDVCDDTLITAPESDIHMRLQHPNLLGGVDIFRPSDVDTCGLPLDNVRQGVLLPLMEYDLSAIQSEDKDAPKHPTFNALRASWQLACALEALYSAGYTHFDIKPQNILQNGDTTYLADFGLSYSTSVRMIDRPLFTLTYRPPYFNAKRFESKYFMAADLYSLGLVFLDITYKSNYRRSWKDYTEDEYVVVLNEDANRTVDILLKFIDDNREAPEMLKLRQQRWNLPLPTLDAMSEYFRIVKDMLSPTPTALTATQVRLRLEALWVDLPTTHVLRISNNPPVADEYRAAATRVVSAVSTPYASLLPKRFALHAVELFLAVAKVMTPRRYASLASRPSWLLPYLVACVSIVVSFYTARGFANAIISYAKENDILYELNYKGPTVLFEEAICEATQDITWSSELKGRYNFMLPGDTLTVPSAA